MNTTTWAEIVTAYEDATRFIEDAFAAPTRPSLARGPSSPDLTALHARLHRRLDELCAALTPDLGPDGAPIGLAPLSFLLDEQVELRLSRGAGDDFPEWPQLQRYLQEVNGGDAFYARARALLRASPPPPALLPALYLFCLRAGFKGRLFDDPTAIERVEDDLRACLGPAPYGGTPPGSPALRRARPWWHYAAGVVLSVAALQVVLLAVARQM